MKVYVRSNGVTFVGKPWQIQHMLNRYRKQFRTIKEWVAATHDTEKPSK